MGSEKAGFEGKSSVKSFESRSKNHAYKPAFLQSQADQNLIGNAILGVLLRSEKMWLDKQCPAAILSMPGIAIWVTEVTLVTLVEKIFYFEQGYKIPTFALSYLNF